MLNIDPNNRALHFSSKYPKVIRHTGIVCVYGTEFFQLKKKKLTHFQWMKSLTTQHFFLKYIPCFLHSLARQLFSFSVIHFTWCYFYMNTNSSQGGHDWHLGGEAAVWDACLHMRVPDYFASVWVPSQCILRRNKRQLKERCGCSSWEACLLHMQAVDIVSLWDHEHHELFAGQTNATKH